MVAGKGAFWQALVFTIIVFIIGIGLGFWLENSRSNDLQRTLVSSETNILDEQLRNRVVSSVNLSCDVASESIFSSADRIYYESMNLEKVDSASKFTISLREVHRRYDILRSGLWVESIQIRNKCPSDFHSVIYLYNYSIGDISINAMQSSFSRVLEDLKNKDPDKVLLIPLAVNTNLESVRTLLDQYNLTKFPAIFIDNKIIIDKLVTSEEIQNIIFNSHKQ